MKWTILLVACVVLITACSNNQPSLVNSSDVDDKLLINIDDAPVDSTGIVPEADEEKVIVEELEPLIAKVDDKQLNIQIRSIDLLRPVFDDTQEYELRFFSSTIDEVESFSVCFTALCSKNPAEMYFSVNDVIVKNSIPSCDKNACYDLGSGEFIDGKNTILFQSHVLEDYYVEDVVLNYNLKNGSVSSFNGEDFLLEESKVTNREFESVDGVSLRSVQTRNFDLSEKETQFDIVLSLDFSEVQGTLVVLCNGVEVYSGDSDKDQEIALSKDLLRVGTNELVFIGSV